MLSTSLETKQKEFEERYDQIFNVNNKVRLCWMSITLLALVFVCVYVSVHDSVFQC